jgi:hypothetical protein
MSAETVPVQNEVESQEIVESPIESEQQEDSSPIEQPNEERVPLSALQKERRKRQEIEQELRWVKEQSIRQQRANETVQEPDESHLEPATREELGRSEQKIIRSVEERSWIKNNPEKTEEINEKLSEFLKQRPHLAAAIEGAPNRYEEAWLLMDALTPKQKTALRPVASPKKEAPGNPAGGPKAAALNQAVDVMNMSDSEFNAWRNSQRKRR